MTIDNLRWLALGLGLGNRGLATRLMAETDKYGWQRGSQLALWLAMSEGRDGVGQWLSSESIRQTADQTAADAILAIVSERNMKEKQMLLAGEMQARAAMLSPADFAEWFEARRVALFGEHSPRLGNSGHTEGPAGSVAADSGAASFPRIAGAGEAASA